MEALKKAYAEMILNTAKEAAARVMASDLKSWRLEQDLMSTKEDAVRMLLRLKLMIDAKTKEAEVTFLNQQKKVDELECQLNEAEGIIVDLRAELNLAQEQLEEAKSKYLHPVRQNESAEQCHLCQNSIPSCEYDEFKTSLDCNLVPITVESSLNSIGETSGLVENVAQGKNEAVRRSNRKRKLKHWDEVIDACSHPFKKVRQAMSTLSCCKSNKAKRCLESDDQLKVEVKTQFGKRVNCLANYPKEKLGDTENLLEDSELMNVFVKLDENDVMVGLHSSSKMIDFDMRCETSTESV